MKFLHWLFPKQKPIPCEHSSGIEEVYNNFFVAFCPKCGLNSGSLTYGVEAEKGDWGLDILREFHIRGGPIMYNSSLKFSHFRETPRMQIIIKYEHRKN